MGIDCEKNINSDKNVIKDIDEGVEKTISIFRKTLPQVLATSAKNLILMDLGMTMAFPTLVIPALLDAKGGGLTFDRSMASWFGSIAFICQPIGSLISGTVMEPLGRKMSMILVNLPHLLGWYLFYSTTSISILFLAAVMMGLGTGFMEAPVITYVGEISEPRLRGVLTSYSGIFVTVGLIIEFLLGTFFEWRTTAIISAAVPILTIIAISQVPETPMWLLSKGRVEEATKSLCWLRGWVPVSMVQQELSELMRYNDASKLVLGEKKPKKSKTKTSDLTVAYSNPGVVLNDESPSLTAAASIPISNAVSPDLVKCSNELKNAPVDRKPTFKETVRDMMRPEMMRPLGLVIAFFIFHNGSGMPAMRAYMVSVFKELRFPVDAHWATVITSVVGFMGVIICTVFVSIVGKRRLTLTSLTGCAVSLLCLSLWTLYNEKSEGKSECWLPFFLFLALSFFFSFGIAPIPWMILSEIFPFRGRGFASGLAAAISYVMGFVTSKTFLDLKAILGLTGIFSLYGTMSLVGVGYVYFKLPETEGRSLEDIENLYKSQKNTSKKDKKDKV